MNDNQTSSSPQPVSQGEQAPALTIPVIDHGGQGGLGCRDLHDPTVPVTLQAHTSHAFSDDTFIELYWDAEVVQRFAVGPEPRPDVQGFQVLPAHIREPEGETWYTAYDPLSGHTQSSPKRRVMVKLNTPGDPDPDNTTPTINEHLAPVANVPLRLDAARNLSVTVAPWPNMQLGDVLKLYWGSRQHALSLPAITADRLNRPQTVEISAALLEAAGADRQLLVNYDIRDRVGNWSLYSLPVFCDVRIGLPAAPAILDADPASGDLDLQTLGDRDVQVQIPVYGDIASGDVISLDWQGDANGVPVVPPLPSLPVTDPRYPPTFSVPNADIVAIAGGSARVHYQVRSDAQPPRTSCDMTVRVRDYPLILPHPAVEQASAGELDPLRVQDGATVMVGYTRMSTDDLITVRCNEQDTVAVPASQPGDRAGEVRFAIPAARIAQLMGQLLDVGSIVIRHGQVHVSDILRLAVLSFPTDETAEVSAPQIVQAPDNQNLDISQLDTDADLLLKPWPFIATGQQLWLQLQGTRQDGSPYQWSHPQWEGYPINSVGAQTTRIALSELRALKDGTDLKLLCEVSFDEGKTRVRLPVRTLYLTVAGAVSGHESWEAPGVEQLPAGHTLAFSSGLRVTALDAVAHIVDTGEAFPSFGRRTLRSGANGTLRLEFGGLIRSLRLSHANAQHNHNLLRFYDLEDVEIHSLSLASGARLMCQHIALERPCAWCKLSTIGNEPGIYLDNLIWSPSPLPWASGVTGNTAPPALIWRVFDQAGSFLPEGSVTLSDTLRFEGTGEPCSVVRLHNHSNLVMTASVTEEGKWAVHLPAQPAGAHAYTVRSADLTPSPSWPIRIASPLTMSTSPASLNGMAIQAPHAWIRKASTFGNTTHRPAHGGIPPYTYSSSDSSVVLVDDEGDAQGTGNGTAIVSVRDRSNHALSYPVTVTNVWRLMVNEGPLNFAQAVEWIDSLQGKRVTLADFFNLSARYRTPWPVNGNYWLCVDAGGGKYTFFHRENQTILSASPDQQDIQGAWCLVPA